MAAELAREIVNAAHPPDRATPFALRIPTEIHPGYIEHVVVTSPIRSGRRVLVIQFPESQGAPSLVYSVEDNLEGAVFCLTSFMLHGDGQCAMEMKPINRNTGGVDEQFTLASWNLTPKRDNKDGQEEVHAQVKKIVAMLFCEVDGAEAAEDLLAGGFVRMEGDS